MVAEVAVTAMDKVYTVLEPYVDTIVGVKAEICGFMHDIMAEMREQVNGKPGFFNETLQ